jgi:translation elongation factor EF-G
MNKNYNELITKLDKVYNKTDIKLKNINISCFKYNDSKAAFLNSFDENKKKLNVVLKQYEKSCQKKIKNFKKNCENQFEIFNDLIQNKLKKRYDFLKGNKLSYIFNEYKNNEFQMNISYNEYNYFNEEDWKESFYSKSYKWLNGITVNYFIHDYKKDKKNVSNKLIDAFNKKLKEIKKNILEFSENEYDNIIEKIKEISNIFNIDWDNLRKNKKEILELSENLKNKIREFFGIKD